MNADGTTPGRIVWIDMTISAGSPAAKAWCLALPRLRTLGWEVECWCNSHDPELPFSRVVSFPTLPLPATVAPFWFCIVSNLYAATRLFRRSRAGAREVWHTNNGMCLLADISTFHFLNQAWLRRLFEIKPPEPRSLLAATLNYSYAALDYLALRFSRIGRFLAVSISLRDEMLAVAPTRSITVLPNCYDPTRYSPEKRLTLRDGQRSELGFTPREHVFAFSSQGHYERKGFWIAVGAVLAAAGKHSVRLLVIGGRPRTLDRIKSRLDATFPEWKRVIVFTGSVPDPSAVLCAADALIFPSHYEGFSLVEIEAAALGLPLLLTPHPGTEMILADGSNGLLISFDPEEAAAQITRFTAIPATEWKVSVGAALKPNEYADRLSEIYQDHLHPSTETK